MRTIARPTLPSPAMLDLDRAWKACQDQSAKRRFPWLGRRNDPWRMLASPLKAVLAEARQVTDPRRVLQLWRLLASPLREDMREQVSAALEEQLSKLDGSQWARLDLAMRSASNHLSFRWLAWDSSPGEQELREWFPNPRVAAKFLCMESSGHWREAGLSILSEELRGDEIPLLLLRSVDWAKPVRELAATQLRRRVVPRFSRQLLDRWPLVLRLDPELRERCSIRALGKATESPLQAQIHRLLLAGLEGGVLSDAFDHPDLLVRRAAALLALEAAGSPQLPWVMGAIYDSNDTALHCLALQSLSRLEDPLHRRTFLEQASHGSSVQLRRQTLYAWLEMDPEGVPLARFSMDPSRSLREAARYYCKQRGIQPIALVRDAMKGGSSLNAKPLRALLQALGECGEPPDQDWLRPFLEHPAPSVRRAAAEALAGMDARLEPNARP